MPDSTHQGPPILGPKQHTHVIANTEQGIPMYKFQAALLGRIEDLRLAMRSDRGEVNIIATVLLIVIAVALIVLFREKIGGWINDLIKTIDSGVNDVNSKSI